MVSSLPNRKHPRLGDYDYSSPGAYFVTICTEKRRCVLSKICGGSYHQTVGQGLAPAAKSTETANLSAIPSDYTIEYTNYGKISERQLLMLEQRYPSLKVDQYVIMPNHIHVIFILRDLTEVNPNSVKWNLNSAGVNPRPTVGDGEEIRVNPCPTVGDDKETGANPRPTIMDIVCTYKSLTTRECKKLYPIKKLFQTSFYDHIIRDKEDYNEIVKYIHKNPMIWRFDELFENE